VPPSYAVLSPHLDDAVLSCALFLAANPGSRVITVFANGPSAVSPLTPWDKAARYFTTGADVMAVRRDEDSRASALLGAAAEPLCYWDSQYRNERYGYDGPQGDDLSKVIVADLLSRAAGSAREAWLIPLGLGHSDHLLTADVGLQLAEQLAGDWYIYEDLPYALGNDGGVQSRKSDLARRGFALEPADTLNISSDRAVKKAAIACHASQRRPLGRRAKAAVRAQERIWALAPR
jgi:LmbE family N-acetylglucosaminyl deacetylase